VRWIVLGWLGQGLFFLRFWLQWRASERAGRSVAPRSFWWMSLGGAMLLGGYTVSVREPILVGGYAASAWIYARNAALADPGAVRRQGAHAIEIAGIAAILALAFAVGAAAIAGGEVAPVWFAVAAGGQLFWSSRFVVQWLASERTGESHFPRSFWWMSLAGNLLLLAYAAHRGDVLLVCAFALGPLVQIRNLMLSR
jgi:4-amino-4-deoxy-L-arabinose transferase